MVATNTFAGIRPVDAPAFIKLAERLFVRNRQEQLEKGIDETLAKIKAIAERTA